MLFAKSNFVITVKMWVRTFNVQMLKNQILFWRTRMLCAYIQDIDVGRCVIPIFNIKNPTNAHIYY